MTSSDLTGPDRTPPGSAAVAPDLDAPAAPAAPDAPDQERLRRWRLVLGGEAGESPLTGSAAGAGHRLTGRDAGIDRALAALYRSEPAPADAARGRSRAAGLGAGAPQVARWLGDIRGYFPTPVVQLLQQDAITRLGLARLLLEPEMLAAVEPDVHLVGTLLALGDALPETTRATARLVVGKVVADLERRLATRTRATLTGALDRGARAGRPRHRDIDWDRTVRANLRNYLPGTGPAGRGTVVPERLVGHARARRAVAREVVLCVDQSGSMASSVVHAAVLGAALASIRTLATRLVLFDTSVVDLTGQLADPVDVLFAARLGGGTDIDRALAYCQSRITRPADTVVVLISDLHEGGIRGGMLRRVAALTAAGVRFVALLALSDDGAPDHDHAHAAALAALGCPAFACTPDAFPEVMAAALANRPLPLPEGGWTTG
ncbi:VWA domain-containing protein [Kitasatospora sp. NBC_01287]|uniref:VWA domain-containing protein n=1 Tax=Kitasatospora sp. NBC_01287 TaxID=2903573 RepID=UPI0022569624|nr:VWA domain-containing protein [Kitasatospora sp. NBC_01287]MCX4748565.1 VWA domain-containing protein [Kitasatospora sp. NBC_01287]